MNQLESPSARWKPNTSDDEQRAFLQQRLSLFAKLMFWLFWVLVAFVIAIYEVYPHMRPVRAHIIHTFAWCGMGLFAVIWYLALHRTQSSLRVLRFIEAFLMFGIGFTFALSAYVSADQHVNVYSAFIWLSFTVFARVLVIPSGGKRTAMMSSISMAPLVGSSVLMAIFEPAPLPIPALVLISGVTVYAAVTTMLATVGSSVLYGLRKQVREAMQLGQYTLDHKLGEGGMGVVYKASHKMLRRPTAIKLLRRAEAADLERFEREVQATSELTHPNTVAIFDYGRSPDGVFYYVMEYLEGTDLERMVRQYGAQPWGRVVHILRQVCGALDEAHSRALIHRDIKPANILLCQRGHIPDVVKVCDFGLVKEVGRSSTTGVNQVAGTPGYLAPEAVTHPDKVGPRSDLYAVGAVGYYLVTGDPVFEGATPMDVCLSHVDREPVPPSARTDNPVDPELERLIMQCLEKDPNRRPESALALRRALGQVPRDEHWSEHLAREWWRAFEHEKGDDSGPLTIASSTNTMTVDLSDRGETTARRGLELDEPG